MIKRYNRNKASQSNGRQLLDMHWGATQAFLHCALCSSWRTRLNLSSSGSILPFQQTRLCFDLMHRLGGGEGRGDQGLFVGGGVGGVISAALGVR
jgi:hypothetical protein